MKPIMCLAVLLLVGCSIFPLRQKTCYVRLPPEFLDPTDVMVVRHLHPETLARLKTFFPERIPALGSWGTGFSKCPEDIRRLLSEESHVEPLSGETGYVFLANWYGSCNRDTLDKDLTDAFITRTCYELTFWYHYSASNLIQHFTHAFHEAGWREKRQGLLIEESIGGPDWIRVYEKDGMKTHVHIPSILFDERNPPKPFEIPVNTITIGFLDCSPSDVFDPGELHSLTNGVSSVESEQIQSNLPNSNLDPSEDEKETAP